MKNFYLLPEIYLKRALAALTIFTFLVPLVTRSDFYFPFIVPRTIFFWTVVEAMFLLYVVLVVQNRAYLPRRNAVTTGMIAFVAVMTVASLFGVNAVHSFWSTFERMDGLIMSYHLLAFYVVLTGTFRHRAAWEKLIQASIFIATIVGLVGLSQLIGVNVLLESSGGSRIASTLGNATYFASYLLIHFFFAAYFLVKRPDNQNDLWLYPYGFIAVDALLLILQLRYGSVEGRPLLYQIFAHPALWATFTALQITAFSTFFPEKIALNKKLIKFFFYGMLAVLFLVLVASTQTRGALVGFAMAALAAYVLLLFRKEVPSSAKLAGSVILAASVIGIIVVFAYKDTTFVGSQPLLSKISSISLTDRTTQTRLLTWGASWKGFVERPILGWGAENFHQVFNKYFPVGIYTEEGTPLWFDRPHNVIIQYAVEGGALALAVFISWIGYTMFLLTRAFKQQYVGIVFVAFLVAYIGQNLFVFDSLNSYVPLYVGLAFISHLVTVRKKGDTTRVAPTPRNVGMIIAIICFLLIAWGCRLFVVNTVTVNRGFAMSYRPTVGSDPSYTINSAREIFSLLDDRSYLGKLEILGAYSELATGLARGRSLQDKDLEFLINELSLRFEDWLERYPDDVRFHIFLMHMYLNTERLNADYLRRILERAPETIALSPTRPQIFYITGRAHMILGEYEQGLADFKRAVELVPHIFEAHWNLFAGYVTVKNFEAARGEIKMLKEIEPFDVDRYRRSAGVYAAGKGFDETEELLLEGIDRYPKDAAILYASLADVYATMGRDAEAREAVRQAVELDPSFETEAQEFLRKLDAGEIGPKRSGA